MNERDFYRSRLPHIQPLGGTFFITTRLHGSVPQVEKQRLAEDFLLHQRQILARPDHTAEELDRLNKTFFVAYETILDKSDYGPKWLSINALSDIVVNALHYFDTKLYDLIAYCLMSNHIHIAFTLNADKNGQSGSYLQQVMHSLKSYTAIKCNEMLDRSGSFWEHESYDRLVRDRNELHRIVNYILQNPVKAGLCQRWQDWKYTYIKPEYNDFD
ncbi:hypothetical protein GO730_22050 [Spirosoma sp. HMF3257]|uniref:Transposase IS200-like domain-containing protein n=1 Tax=Spirosoma telluris TaxID=2183553 RepID=A0A327NQ98_9BACT|nr:hypothetical protein [Spirosoma telluris]RAI76186.1 hypothetical protein HMF3257_21980 [Spirosoma telluris]